MCDLHTYTEFFERIVRMCVESVHSCPHRGDRVWTRLHKLDAVTQEPRFFTVECFLERNEHGYLTPYVYLVEYLEAVPFYTTVLTIYQFGSWVWHNMDNLCTAQETSLLYGDREPIVSYYRDGSALLRMCAAYFIGFCDDIASDERDGTASGLEASLRCCLVLIKDEEEGGSCRSVDDFMVDTVKYHVDEKANRLANMLWLSLREANQPRFFSGDNREHTGCWDRQNATPSEEDGRACVNIALPVA